MRLVVDAEPISRVPSPAHTDPNLTHFFRSGDMPSVTEDQITAQVGKLILKNRLYELKSEKITQSP